MSLAIFHVLFSINGAIIVPTGAFASAESMAGDKVFSL